MAAETGALRRAVEGGRMRVAAEQRGKPTKTVVGHDERRGPLFSGNLEKDRYALCDAARDLRRLVECGLEEEN